MIKQYQFFYICDIFNEIGVLSVELRQYLDISFIRGILSYVPYQL